MPPILRGDRIGLAPAAGWEVLAQHGVMRWTIDVRGRRIGHVALRSADPTSADYEITIDRPAYRSHGYGTETTRLVLTYAFDTLHLPRVRLRLRPCPALA